MSEFIFRNRTADEQSLLIGEGYIVGPYEEVVLDQQEAGVARDRYKAILEEVRLEGIGSKLDVNRDEPIWIANMAGDPDAPTDVDYKPGKNKLTGQTEMQKVPNMLAVPRDFSVRWRESTQVKKIGSATQELKFPKQKKTIRVWERKPVAPKLARAFLRRASALGAGAKNWIIASRAPSAFEPDSSWSLDDTRAWIAMVDHKMEETIKNEPGEAKIRRDSKSEAEAKKKIQRDKIKNLKRVHLRASNPKFALPTRSEFEQFIGRDEVQKALGDEQAIADAEKVLAAQLDEPKKKPGRPKKVITD